MSSPGQKRGSCGHAMAGFDGHAFCARCREKGKGEEPCIANKETTDCKFCNLFTSENVPRYPHLPRNSRRKKGKLNVWITLPPQRKLPL